MNILFVRWLVFYLIICYVAEVLDSHQSFRAHTGGRVFGKKLELSEGELDPTTAKIESADMSWLGALSAQAQDFDSDDVVR